MIGIKVMILNGLLGQRSCGHGYTSRIRVCKPKGTQTAMPGVARRLGIDGVQGSRGSQVLSRGCSHAQSTSPGLMDQRATGGRVSVDAS